MVPLIQIYTHNEISNVLNVGLITPLVTSDFSLIHFINIYEYAKLNDIPLGERTIQIISLIIQTQTCNNGHARIQEISSGGGGGPGQSDKKALTTLFFCFFSPQHILQKSNG